MVLGAGSFALWSPRQDLRHLSSSGTQTCARAWQAWCWWSRKRETRPPLFKTKGVLNRGFQTKVFLILFFCLIGGLEFRSVRKKEVGCSGKRFFSICCLDSIRWKPRVGLGFPVDLKSR